MPIKEVSKYNYKEICSELKIDYNDFLALIQRGSTKIFPSSDLTQQNANFVIEKFINSLLQHEFRKIKSANTIKYYLSFLNRFNSYLYHSYPDLLFLELNEEIFFKFIDHQKKENETSELTQSSINTYIAILKKLCTFSVEKGYINKNIGYKFRKIKVNYLPRYFTHQHLRNIFKVVENRRCSLLWKTLFLTLLGTGLRVDEVVRLKIKDVDFENNLIYTLGKGNKERFIPLYPEVKRAIKDYLSFLRLEDTSINGERLVFTRGKTLDKKVSVRSIQFNVQKIRKELNLDSRYTAHSFRHTFAVNCLRAKMQIMYLSQILGHEDPATTSIYTKLLPEDLQTEILEKFPIPLESLIKEIITGE
jgi:site-specific recombinase XerD